MDKSVPIVSSNLTQSPAFKEWFGDGNLVDESGNPLPLYHGTNRKFTEFKRSKTGAMGSAVYLGDHRSVAEAYDGDGKGKQIIMTVYARGKYLTNMEWTGYIIKHGWTGAEAAAQADGWSGVHDTMFEDAVAVWNPADIKSATDNSGAFAEVGNIKKFAARDQTETPAKSADGNKGNFDQSENDVENGGEAPCP